MRILLLCHSFNSLTQRLYVELVRRGHEVRETMRAFLKPIIGLSVISVLLLMEYPLSELIKSKTEP